MKKNKNKGFMLAETIIVASFISITLVYIFVQLRNISNNYSTDMSYNSVNGMYINNEIKKFISQYNMDEIALQIAYSDLGYYDLTSCNSNIFIDTDYCNEFFSRLNIKTSIFTFEKVNVTGTSFSEEFNKFLKSIHVPNSNMYIIATEFNDGTFASIKLNGYHYPTIEDRIKNQVIVTNNSGLYNNTSSEGEMFVFRGNNSVNNHINVFGYQGRIIEMNSQGVKVILKKEENLKFDNNRSFYTKNSLLSFGRYIESSNSNSLLFSSLNSLAKDYDDIVVEAFWPVGKITTLVGNSLENIIGDEKTTVFKGYNNAYIGSISVSDVIKASINSSCNQISVSVDCLSDNWLAGDTWTMNANTFNTVWAIKNNAFINDSITNTNSAYAVIYLKKSMKAIGDGTIDNPYRAV